MDKKFLIYINKEKDIEKIFNNKEIQEKCTILYEELKVGYNEYKSNYLYISRKAYDEWTYYKRHY